MRFITALLLLALATVPLGGCSVAMALDGAPDPDLSVITADALRADVESELGPPVDEVTDEDGVVHATYHIVLGNEPSVVRAITHGAFDVLTFGLWEIAGTMIEGAVEEADHEIVVTYDPMGQLLTFRELDPALMEEEPESMIVSAEE